MVVRVGTSRTGTRHKLRKHVRSRGKVSLKRYFQSFQVGDKVGLVPEPSVHRGKYFPRFIGKHGIVKGTQGSCYKVEIDDSGKTKMIVAHPVHLKKV